jgi:pyrroline-5-carboxylate reductase
VVEKSTSLIVSEIDAARRGELMSKYKMIIEIDNNYVVKYSDIIIIAVKPKDFESVLKHEVCCGISPKKLIISIAAGITTKHIEDIVGKDVPVIRVMPNMAAIIGEAISSISAGTSAAKEHMKMARKIFSMIGEVIEIEEELVDAVTAISGSGPAYFFYLTEMLIDAARELKLDKNIAEKLVTKTAIGSMKLLEALKEEPARLRRRVTSKGGTTEAALRVFEERGLKRIVEDAVIAAWRRSIELSAKRKAQSEKRKTKA